MLHAGTEPVARVPTADTQLSALLESDEPVVGLFLFCCADVARYGLPDHRNPPSPRSVSADFNGSARTFPSLRNKKLQAERAIPLEISWELPSFISSRIPVDGRV